MEILRSYLVNLGFRVERSSERQFTESVGKTAARVTDLGAAVEAMGAALAAVVTKMSEHFEDLYYASERMGSSVQNIQAFSFGLSQVGAKADDAKSALDGLADRLRSSPATEGLLKGLGVQTRDVNGELRDTTDLLEETMATLHKRYQGAQYFQGQQIAQSWFGVDPRTYLAMGRDFEEFQAKQKDRFKRYGADQQAFAVAGKNFAQQFRSTQAEFTVAFERVFMQLIPRIEPVLSRIEAWMERNGPLVATGLTNLLTGVWDMALNLGRIAVRVFDFMVRLDGATHGVSTALLGLLAVWRVLNLGVLATPLGAAVGAVVALGVAIAGLVDDYQTWARGGASLFDWSGWKDTIDGAGKAFGALGRNVEDFAKKLGAAVGKELPGLASSLVGLAQAMTDLGTALAPLAGWMISTFGPAAIHFVTSGINLITDSIEALADAVKVVADVLRGDFRAAAADAGKFGAAISRRVDTDRTPPRDYTRGKPNTTETDRNINGVVDTVRKYGPNGQLISQTGAPVVVGLKPEDKTVRLHPDDRSMFEKLALWFSGDRRPTPGLDSPFGSPQGPEGTQRVSGNVKALADQAMAYFQSAGWTKAQAAGITATLQRESLFSARAVGDSGLARGIMQWHPDRQRDFARWAGHDLSASTYREQLEFTNWELTKGMRQAAGRRLRTSTSAREAGQVVSMLDAAPADKFGEARIRGNLADHFATEAPQPTGAKTVTIHQKTDVHVKGDNARDTGRAVADAQGRVNADLTRSTAKVMQ